MQTDRKDKITDIHEMLDEMSDEQVENVHVYTADEYREPNHEAVALEANSQLSRKDKKEDQE